MAASLDGVSGHGEKAMKYWSLLAAPFVLYALLVGFLRGFEAVERYRYRRAARIRNEKLQRYNMGAFKGTKDRWLS